VGGVHAQYGRGRGNLVYVDALHAVFILEPQHDFFHLVLPQRRHRAHDPEFYRRAVAFLAAVAFYKGGAVLHFGDGGQSHARELAIFRAPVMGVPKSAVDIGHHENVGVLQFAHGLGEAVLYREIVRIVVVKGNLVPVVPVEPDGNLQERGEGLHPGNHLLRGAAGLGPRAQFPHPERRVGAAAFAQPGPPLRLRFYPGLVPLRGVIPVALEQSPHRFSGQNIGIRGRNLVRDGMFKEKFHCPRRGLGLQDDFLGGAHGIVHGIVKARGGPILARGRKGSHELHAAPAAAVALPLLQILRPQVPNQYARAVRIQDAAAGRGFVERHLGEHDILEARFPDCAFSLQVPFPGMGGGIGDGLDGNPKRLQARVRTILPFQHDTALGSVYGRARPALFRGHPLFLPFAVVYHQFKQGRPLLRQQFRFVFKIDQACYSYAPFLRLQSHLQAACRKSLRPLGPCIRTGNTGGACP